MSNYIYLINGSALIDGIFGIYNIGVTKLSDEEKNSKYTRDFILLIPAPYDLAKVKRRIFKMFKIKFKRRNDMNEYHHNIYIKNIEKGWFEGSYKKMLNVINRVIKDFENSK